MRRSSRALPRLLNPFHTRRRAGDNFVTLAVFLLAIGKRVIHTLRDGGFGVPFRGIVCHCGLDGGVRLGLCCDVFGGVCSAKIGWR